MKKTNGLLCIFVSKDKLEKELRIDPNVYDYKAKQIGSTQIWKIIQDFAFTLNKTGDLYCVFKQSDNPHIRLERIYEN